MFNKKKILLYGGLGLVVLFLLFFVVPALIGAGQRAENVNLTMWGVFDDAGWYRETINTYEAQNPHVDITYQPFDFANYEENLINAFASTEGPDIFLMHHTWLPKHHSRIAPLRDEYTDSVNGEPLMLLKDFEAQFVDVTRRDLVASDTIFAVPLYVDTLALYYNKNAFNDAGIANPPTTWEEFNNAVRQLTITNERGDLVRSGAAIGTADNVNRSTDIVAMLMLQSGVKMTNDDNTRATFAQSTSREPLGQLALQYYTDFTNQAQGNLYTWDDEQHYSIDAFVQGEAVMMFNYSHHIATIRNRAARFDFDVAPVPQFSDNLFDVTYANYWAPTVSKQSPHVEEAWRFLTFLSSDQGVRDYLIESARPTARRDIVDEQRTDVDLGVFAQQTLTAASWYQIDARKIETIFADMIDDVNFNRKSIPAALQAAQDRVNVEMAK